MRALAAGRAGIQPNPAPAADTAGYVKGGYGKFIDTFRLGELTKADGTTLTAYLPSTRLGYERIIDYFDTPPGQKPTPSATPCP